MLRLVDNPYMTIVVYHGPKAATTREVVRSKIISLLKMADKQWELI